MLFCVANFILLSEGGFGVTFLVVKIECEQSFNTIFLVSNSN